MASVRKIAVVGCRPTDDPIKDDATRDAVRAFVDKLDPVTTVVISGGAAGVDTWAEERARSRNIRVVVIRPNWKKYGRSAGFRRNKEIVLTADDVAAFWDGLTKGTENTIKHAIRLRRPTAVFRTTGELVRFINPGELVEHTMSTVRSQFTRPKGPAQRAPYAGRPERTARRKAEHKARRDAHKIEGRLEEQGVWLPGV